MTKKDNQNEKKRIEKKEQKGHSDKEEEVSIE